MAGLGLLTALTPSAAALADSKNGDESYPNWDPKSFASSCIHDDQSFTWSGILSNSGNPEGSFSITVKGTIKGDRKLKEGNEAFEVTYGPYDLLGGQSVNIGSTIKTSLHPQSVEWSLKAFQEGTKNKDHTYRPKRATRCTQR